jgi:predicted TIM-barrel fold metal-dependent hydrolase
MALQTDERQGQAGERLMMISSDTHASPPIEGFADYVEQKDMAAYQAELDARQAFRDHSSVGKAQGKSEEMNTLQQEQGLGPGTRDPEVKARHEEADGVVGCVIFPNGPRPFSPEYRERAPLGLPPASIKQRVAGARIYNRWLADFCSAYPDRFFGIAQIEIEDVDSAVAEVKWAAENGLRGGIAFPGVAPSGEYPGLHDEIYEPLWSVCEEYNMPLNTHGVDSIPAQQYPFGHVANILLTLTEAFFFSTRHLWWLMWTGVFDRHPRLKLTFAELLADWIPRTLSDLDSTLNSNLGAEGRSVLELTPTEYWQRHCFVGASFMSRTEANARHDVGLDSVMWGSDYPHVEGTWPHTRESLRNTLAGLPVEDIRKMLGENALRCYSFDPDKMRALADQFGPTIDEISTPLEEIPDTAQARLGMAFREGDHWT